MPLTDYATRTDRLFYTLGRIEGELRLNDHPRGGTPDKDTIKKIRQIIKEYDDVNEDELQRIKEGGKS